MATRDPKIIMLVIIHGNKLLDGDYFWSDSEQKLHLGYKTTLMRDINFDSKMKFLFFQNIWHFSDRRKSWQILSGPNWCVLVFPSDTKTPSNTKVPPSDNKTPPSDTKNIPSNTKNTPLGHQKPLLGNQDPTPRTPRPHSPHTRIPLSPDRKTPPSPDRNTPPSPDRKTPLGNQDLSPLGN